MMILQNRFEITKISLLKISNELTWSMAANTFVKSWMHSIESSLI
jgi:hypothetical protein